MSDKPRREIPHLHVRRPRRGGANPGASIVGNRAGLLRLRDQVDHTLLTEDGLASMRWSGYREIDGLVFDPIVHSPTALATRPEVPSWSSRPFR